MMSPLIFLVQSRIIYQPFFNHPMTILQVRTYLVIRFHLGVLYVGVCYCGNIEFGIMGNNEYAMLLVG